MDALEQYLSQRYWTEDDLLREVKADIAERGPQIQVSAEAGRLLSLLVRAAGATRVLEVGHAVRLQRHLDGARAARRRPARHDRDREAARRCRRALVRARRPGRPRDRAPRSGRRRAGHAARPLRRRVHRRRQGDLPRVHPAVARAAAPGRHGDRRQRDPPRPDRAARRRRRPRRHARHARPARGRLRRSSPRPCRSATGSRSPSSGAEGVTTYKPSPRPTFDGPALIPYASVTRHIWGDPEAGEVADWIYASTEHVHALLFGLAPGAWFRHSPEFRTIFGADELLYVLRGHDGASRTPRRARCCGCRAAATRSSAPTRGTTCTPTATRSCACSSSTRRRRPPGSSGAYARTKPYLEQADWRYGDDALLGHLPGSGARAPHAVRARRSSGAARSACSRALYCSTEHLTAGDARAEPRRDLGDPRARRRRGRLRARGRAARARVRRGRHQRLRAQSGRRGLHPQGRRARVPQLRLRSGASALRRGAHLPAVTLAIGIDVGGTKIAAGLVDTDTRRVRGALRACRRGPSAAAAPCSTDCVAHGRAARGGPRRHADRDGRVRARRPRGAHAARRETVDWRGARRRRRVRRDRPCRGRERRARRGRGRGALRRRAAASRELLYVTVSTGISHCLVLGGRPYAGARGNAICTGAPPLEDVASG